MTTPSPEAIEAAARAWAIYQESDGCFERVEYWESLEDWEREANPEEYPESDYEDCQYYLERAKVALVAANQVAESQATADKLQEVFEQGFEFGEVIALNRASDDAFKGGGGGVDDGECADWAKWLRSRAEVLEEKVGKPSEALLSLIGQAKADVLKEMADAVLTNDPLDYWAQHLPEGLGFQEALSSWLIAHAGNYEYRDTENQLNGEFNEQATS